MHPLFFFSYLAAAAVIVFTWRPQWAMQKWVGITAIVLAALLIAVYIYRLVAVYPATEPMVYNYNSLFGLIRKRFGF